MKRWLIRQRLIQFKEIPDHIIFYVNKQSFHLPRTEYTPHWPPDRMRRGSDCGSSSYRCPSVQTEQRAEPLSHSQYRRRKRMKEINRGTSYSSGDGMSLIACISIRYLGQFFRNDTKYINKMLCVWWKESINSRSLWCIQDLLSALAYSTALKNSLICLQGNQ